MNFKESLDYLFGLGYERSVQKFGLENSIILLNALGNPQNKFVKIQVAGTNGKGSTCAFLESICVQAGIKVGVNTSPHLISVTERIRVSGDDVPEEKFAEYVTRVREVSEKLVETNELEAMPTFFEHITAIAQLVFADEGIEVAILEAGLGGRFDATTATQAEIVAITSIDLDHTRTLGDTVAKIATEKAAIIREGVEAVIAVQKDEVMDVILEKCRSVDVFPHLAKQVNTESQDELVAFQTSKAKYARIRLGLKGKHQIENASVAILLAETLNDKGFAIEKKDIEAGLENALHAGRLEYQHGILFDGAHNVSGAKTLRSYIKENINKRITMVFGVMQGKEIKQIAGILFPLVENLILTTTKDPRAMPSEEILKVLPIEIPVESIFVTDDSRRALKKAQDIVDDGLIIVTGSLYLIGEVKTALNTIDCENSTLKR